ncbi:hypothetical protein BD560DRAFT_453555 [Blakeslea trispora]|nr:hypothetical protein BD560DRAFT_453555 [Blakeslea trispora]
MDEQSRKLIEQMLAEEEYYYGTDTISTLNKKNKRKSPQQVDLSYSKKPKKEGRSSASLPSHKTRWSEEEDSRLKEALEKYSYGNWKLIAEYVKTRNPLQCKNHARHLQMSDKINHSVSIATTKNTVSTEPSQVTQIVPESAPSPKEEEKKESRMDQYMTDKEDAVSMNEDDELSIDDNDENKQIDKEATQATESIPNQETIATESKQKSAIEQAELEKDNFPVVEPNTIQTSIDQAISIHSVKKDLMIVKQPHKEEEKEEKSSKDQTEMTAMDTIMFDPYTVSEAEKLDNPEWFRQKYSKTPDRYLKIRNHMLACWQQCKPRYLTKTSARKGLKDCGDVNAIGRVHEYLESLGAINVDCVTSAPRPPKRIMRDAEEDVNMKDFVDASEFVIGYDGPRKRKVRNEYGDWVDPKELEGRVIEHGQVITRVDSRPKRIPKRSFHQHYYGGDDFSRGYDPFRLVPALHYDEETPAPFEVNILSDALLVMDFHSHLAHTEIIGLLGGNFVVQGESKILQVKAVFPCKSTSTGIQCEMDPTSEMKAREEFAERGLNVVGWYHSHPTFEPHPSIRDIENQTSYQTLFQEEKTGDEPFIGVIVTPYDPEILSNHSQIQYLHISKQWDQSHSFRVPYACKRKVIQTERVGEGILDQLSVLLDEYKDYEHKMNMIDSFGTQTRLGKLLDSLRAHLFINKEDEEQFLTTIKNVIMEKFVDTPINKES